MAKLPTLLGSVGYVMVYCGKSVLLLANPFSFLSALVSDLGGMIPLQLALVLLTFVRNQLCQGVCTGDFRLAGFQQREDLEEDGFGPQL